MKIVHICLCDPYNENWAYHRNILSEQNKKDGHDVYIITTSYNMNVYGKHEKNFSGWEKNKYGIEVIRLKDKYFLPKSVKSKLNTVKGVGNILKKISPDIIMVHNIQTFNLYEIVKYRMDNPQVILLGDSHAGYCNSARNPISRYFVQGILFKKVIQDNFKGFDNFYFITASNYEFFEDRYKIKLREYNILPLPARFVNINEKQQNKIKIREELHMNSNELLFVHSGKMVKEKKTVEILNSLKRRKEKFRLVLIGSIPKQQNNVIKQLISEDSRFIYLGWKTSEELSKYLSAADLYLQPGSESITMQNALAAGTPIMIYPHKDYEMFFNGWEICIKNEKEMIEAFDKIFSKPEILKPKMSHAYETAMQYFDCSKFAKKMYIMAKV